MRKFAAVLLVLLMSSTWALAQDLKITGRILSVAGQPVEGASVTVKGSGRGVSTNAAGEYTITASRGQVLVVSSVGYGTSEKVVNGSTLDFSLTENNDPLADVVVVGYGTQRRAAVTSAIAVVKGDQLIKRPLASTSMALQGFAPGVVVQQGSGQPGADGGSINIRGIGSITGSSAPLIIVDGVEGVSINDIDPNVIDNISVLKDAASTAVYGVRGTNGVILIKTKRGQAGKTSISFNSFVTKQTPTNFPELLSAVDNLILNNEAVSNTGSTVLPYPQALIDLYRSTPANNLTVFDTDWKDLIFQNNGLLQNHNIIVNGGSDKVSFLASGTYLNQQGIIVNNSFKKYDLRINSDVKLSRKLKFSTDLFYTNATNIQPAGMSPNEIVQRGISMARNFPGKFGEGQYGDAGQSNRINPVGAAEASGINKAQTPTLSLRFAVNYEVFKNFVIDASYNSRASFTEAYAARGTYNSFNPNPVTNAYVFDRVIGDSLLSYTNNRNITNQYFGSATYSYNLADAHQFKIQGGFQGLDNTVSSVGASRAGLTDPSRPYLNLATSPLQPSVSGSATDYSLAGFFGRFNYDYKQKYLLELTGRYDGSSRFSQLLDKQWGFFPGASAGWVISKEGFMEKVGFIDYAKLRVSYGKLGNQEVGGNYPFVAALNAGTAYYFNGNITPGSSLNNIPNEIVSWENSAQSNIGIDLAILKSRLNITFDYYQKKVTDNLIDFPVANALGYAGSSFIPANAASMINKGWELSATYRNSIGKLNYNITGNFSDVKNKVLDTRELDIVQGNQLSRAGYPIRSYYLYRTNGLYQAGDNFAKPFNGSRTTGPGDIRYVDTDGNDTINAKDRVLLGNNFPRYDYSLNVNLDYKGFDLNLFLFGVGKRDNYISGVGVEPFNAGNWIASGLTTALDRWTPGKTSGNYPRLYSGGNGNYVASDFWLRDGSFMRVKHITLGYTLAKSLADRMGIQQLRFYVNAVNPFTVSNYEPGFDPEVSNSNGAFYPIMKTYTAGVNLRF
ncbi:TonB-dependent receptor [Segetibacter sp. 3557_3]|uniref:SusC/RagA family TonB-linked outer membrane protein n=1 Tax=Segetibacter sp. 3557_3 TaxID=2547429 RepID=UPI001058B0E4|nr:TonB-dependent receptor [Segetibacter sp. 3557_3]TDH28533.1 TonB-dependent receptor [Segetibacter sp. 3557_3]